MHSLGPFSQCWQIGFFSSHYYSVNSKNPLLLYVAACKWGILSHYVSANLKESREYPYGFWNAICVLICLPLVLTQSVSTPGYLGRQVNLLGPRPPYFGCGPCTHEIPKIRHVKIKINGFNTWKIFPSVRKYFPTQQKCFENAQRPNLRAMKFQPQCEALYGLRATSTKSRTNDVVSGEYQFCIGFI